MQTLLKFKRNQLVYKQIHDFNYRLSLWIHNSWQVSLPKIQFNNANELNLYQSKVLAKRYKINQYYFSTNDLWLRLISLSWPKLDYILTQVLLTIIVQSTALSLDGKRLAKLKSMFTTATITRALNYEHALGIKEFPWSMLETNNWQLMSKFLLLEHLYRNKHPAMQQRIPLLFPQDLPLMIPQGLKDYWNKIQLIDIEELVKTCLRHRQVHLLTFKPIF